MLKLRKGRWRAAALRVTAHAVERLDPASGLVKWRLEFRHMASPAGGGCERHTSVLSITLALLS